MHNIYKFNKILKCGVATCHFLNSDFPILTFSFETKEKEKIVRSRHLASYLKKVRHPFCPPYHGNIKKIRFLHKVYETASKWSYGQLSIFKKSPISQGGIFRIVCFSDFYIFLNIQYYLILH